METFGVSVLVLQIGADHITPGYQHSTLQFVNYALAGRMGT